jgi:coenzyme F420-dependent glucose-6-phosphate dehydrogenase
VERRFSQNGLMAHPVRFGYKVSAEQFGPADLLDFTRAAERCGFDTAAISDHFQPWRHNGGHAPFSLSWLGAAGQATTRIQLGTSVLTPTFRYHPAVIAQAFGTLGCLFPGRIWLGVGTGESLNEAPLGLEWPDSKERFARLKEAVSLIQALWTTDRLTFDGTFYRTRNATIYDRPATPIPIYIAAAGPSAARLAGRIADGLLCTSGKGMELYSETLLPAVIEGARAAGRDPADLDLAIEIKVSYDTDAERAREDTRNWAALALSAEEKVGVEDPIEMERLADALTAERAASRWIVSNDPDDLVEQIRPYLDLGFTHLIFHGPGADQRRFLDLFSRDVLPPLRRATA